jgi:hypothetical protein
MYPSGLCGFPVNPVQCARMSLLLNGGRCGIRRSSKAGYSNVGDAFPRAFVRKAYADIQSTLLICHSPHAVKILVLLPGEEVAKKCHARPIDLGL